MEVGAGKINPELSAAVAVLILTEAKHKNVITSAHVNNKNFLCTKLF